MLPRVIDSFGALKGTEGGARRSLWRPPVARGPAPSPAPAAATTAGAGPKAGRQRGPGIRVLPSAPSSGHGPRDGSAGSKRKRMPPPPSLRSGVALLAFDTSNAFMPFGLKVINIGYPSLVLA